MASSELGRPGAVSMALGGMIGGGIYAVLGVVADIAGTTTWLAFVLAGVVALNAGDAACTLNDLTEDDGGAVTFVQSFVGNSTLAGMVGWTLLVGYVGSMAMYAFAFAEFTLWFDAVPATVGPVPLRPALSVSVVAAFVAVNYVGPRTSGVAEETLVAAKVAVLLAFGALGLAFAWFYSPSATLSYGLADAASFSPVLAAAVSFVAFQGWQLLFYDQARMADATDTIRQSVYASISLAVLVYALVAVVTTNLVPAAVRSNPYTALVDAAATMASPWGLEGLATVFISASALFSTASALNATLFSSAHFAKGMVADGLLPDRVGADDADGVPPRSLAVLGVVTAALAAWGSLGAVTSFASLAFILVFGGVCVVAVRERARDAVNPLPPAVGAVGSFAFFPLLLWHLYVTERHTFWLVLVIAAVVLGVELLYFEREDLEREIESVAGEVAEDVAAAADAAEALEEPVGDRQDHDDPTRPKD